MADDRNPNGTYKKGHKGVGGRPSRASELAFLELLKAAVTDTDREAIFERLITECKAGDVAAMKLLFSYWGGLPKQLVEQDILQRVEVEYVNDWR